MNYPVVLIRVWLVVCTTAVLLVFVPAGRATALESRPAADDGTRVLEAQLEVLDTRAVEDILADINRGVADYLPPVRLGDVIAGVAAGRLPLDISLLLHGLGRYLFREILASIGLLGKLVILAVVSAVLYNLQASFERESVGRLAYAACYLVLVGIAIGSFRVALHTATAILDNLVSLMVALLPLLTALLAGVGAFTSAGLFHPVMVFVIHAVSVGVRDVVFPLLLLAAVLDIAGGFSDSFRVSGLAGLMRQFSIGALGIFLSLFLGVMVMVGAGGVVADGVTLRAAKFLSAAFIPVVGKMMADAAELVLGSSLLLKNAVGIAGATALVATTAFPLAKIVSLVLVYRLAGAFIQPVGSEGVVGCLHGMGNALTLMFISIATVAIMFFIALTIIIGAGNAVVMIR